MNRIIAILFFVTLLPQLAVMAADISVEASLDRNKGFIGDRIGISLEITADTTLLVDSVNLEGSSGDFEVLEWQLDTIEIREDFRIIDYSGKLTIYKYKIGNVYLPSIPIIYHTPEGKTDSLFTDSITVYIDNLVSDDSADILGLKDVKSLGRSHAWLYFLIPAAALIVALILFFSLRRKAVIEKAEKAVLKSPWEAARDRLIMLRESNLKPKPYYIELSETIREYIQRRYGFSAMDMTTFEIRMKVNNLNIAADLAERLMNLLDNADLVKFAKFLPEKRFMEADFQRAWSFVKATMPSTKISEETAIEEAQV